jgi:hypothetical protein
LTKKSKYALKEIFLNFTSLHPKNLGNKIKEGILRPYCGYFFQTVQILGGGIIKEIVLKEEGVF